MTSALLDAPTTVRHLAIGVADLAGFTRLSRFVDLPHLDLVLRAFEDVCREVLDGAEIVTPTADGVLFALGSSDAAVAAAFDLVETARQQPLLPPVRVAVAAGPVLVRHGDCFGAPVDTAKRLIAGAQPGSVVRHRLGALTDA